MEANKKQASFFKFEDLRLYDKAVEYNKWLVATFRTKQISKAEDILVDDFVRASLTVAKCIAEGAETKSQVERLKQMGCKVIQGFYFSKPIPLEEFENKYLVRE